MTHDPLCPFSRECIGGEHEPFAVGPLACSNTECLAICDCDLIAKVRADERSRKGTCWREAKGSQIPAGAIRVYREAGWFWEMP